MATINMAEALRDENTAVPLLLTLHEVRIPPRSRNVLSVHHISNIRTCIQLTETQLHRYLGTDVEAITSLTDVIKKLGLHMGTKLIGIDVDVIEKARWRHDDACEALSRRMWRHPEYQHSAIYPSHDAPVLVDDAPKLNVALLLRAGDVVDLQLDKNTSRGFGVFHRTEPLSYIAAMSDAELLRTRGIQQTTMAAIDKVFRRLGITRSENNNTFVKGWGEQRKRAIKSGQIPLLLAHLKDPDWQIGGVIHPAPGRPTGKGADLRGFGRG